MKKVVDPRYAGRNKRYGKIIAALETASECPFCPDGSGTFKYPKNPTLKRRVGWRVVRADFPYRGTQHHFLIIANRHHESFSRITKRDCAGVWYLARWAIRKFKVRGGALMLRFGDTRFTGATVCHLHFHLIAPTLNKKGVARTVMFPVG